jgi:hypothetical protein
MMMFGIHGKCEVIMGDIEEQEEDGGAEADFWQICFRRWHLKGCNRCIKSIIGHATALRNNGVEE